MRTANLPLLQIRNLQKGFTAPDGRRQQVLEVPDFSLRRGEQRALAGASGSGKTTFLNLIAGILKPDAGFIRIGSDQVSALRESQRDRFRAVNIGYIFQTFNLLQGFTCLENVLLGMKFGKGADEAYARQLLDSVGLGDRLNYRPRQLSSGQQQRVAVARALANRPQLVLADEPTGNLDRKNSGAVLDLIRSACRLNQAALLFVSHDQDVLGQFGEVQDFRHVNRVADGTEPA